MAYTTATQVQDLLPELQGDDSTTVTTALASFIEAANVLIVELLPETVVTYTDDRYEIIERWLSAHFYRVSQGEVMSETVGPLTSTFLFKTGYALYQTRFGQQAMVLDTSGILSRYNHDLIKGQEGRKSGVAYVGGATG